MSNLGNVRFLDRFIVDYNGVDKFIRGKVLKPGITNKGYQIVNLQMDRQGKVFTVHRLVAITFIPLVEGKNFVNHIDGNKLNNNSDNLEWVTNSENMDHAIKLGLIDRKKYVNRDIKYYGNRYEITLQHKETKEIVVLNSKQEAREFLGLPKYSIKGFFNDKYDCMKIEKVSKKTKVIKDNIKTKKQKMSLMERREKDRLSKRERRSSSNREEYLKQQEFIKQQKIEVLRSIILDNPSLNQKQLAEKMNVSRKTIYRLYKCL